MARSTMRLLSLRLRSLHAVDSSVLRTTRSVRFSSRYSNPSARPAVAVPAQASYFIDPDVDPDTLSNKIPDQPRNPLDTINAQREYAAVRGYHLQRMRFAGIGLLLSVTGLAAVLYNLDLDDIEAGGRKKRSTTQLDASSESNETFQGRKVHVIGAGEDKRIVAEAAGDEETDLVQTGTSSVPFFPRYLYLPSSPASSTPPTAAGAAPNTPLNPGNVHDEEEYALVGLGIRTVSFLSIQVYVMGLYIRKQDISTLQARLIHTINADASTLVPSEKDELKKRLLDPQASTDIWEQLLKEKDIKSAWRIVPTRNTDFAHLRDGWITGIKRGTQEAANVAKVRASGAAAVTEYEDESFGAAVRDFKDLFVGGGSAPKGSVVTLLRHGSGSLEILFEDQSKTKGMEKMGKVDDPRISRLVWMGYLAGKNVSSEAARRGVVDGCVKFAGRPVGSVETMVT